MSLQAHEVVTRTTKIEAGPFEMRTMSTDGEPDEKTRIELWREGEDDEDDGFSISMTWGELRQALVAARLLRKKAGE